MEKSEKILHEKFVEYGRSAREWTRKCALLLPEIERREIWKKRGFGSIYEYAAKLAGMSHAAVEAALWTLRKIEDKPILQRIVKEKGIESVRPIANLATTTTAAFWAEKVREMSKNTLAAYAKEFRKTQNLQNLSCAGAEIPITKQTENISMELELEVAEQLTKLRGQGEWNNLMKKFLEEHKERMEAKKPEAETAMRKAKSRYIPAKIKNYVIAKTAGTCAFPGCYKPYEILHHTERFALTHTHNPNTLVPLCKAHERIAHLGLIENENAQSNEWRLRAAANPTEKKYGIDRLVMQHRKKW